MIFAPILCWFSARNIPSDRWHRHQPKGRFRGWRYSCPGRHGLARHTAAQLYCQGDPKGGERRVPNGADWKRVSVSGLYFVGRLESGLRFSGAAYRAGGNLSTTRVSRRDVWEPRRRVARAVSALWLAPAAPPRGRSRGCPLLRLVSTSPSRGQPAPSPRSPALPPSRPAPYPVSAHAPRPPDRRVLRGDRPSQCAPVPLRAVVRLRVRPRSRVRSSILLFCIRREVETTGGSRRVLRGAGCSPAHQRSKRQRVGVKDSPSVGRPNAFVGVIS